MDDEFRPQGFDPDQWPDGIPPCLVSVDLDGRLWHKGEEITHPGIAGLIFENVNRDADGRYIVTVEDKRCFLDVADTLFVIVRVDGPTLQAGPPDQLTVRLNDGSSEPLHPATLRQNSEHVMYAEVKNGRFPARFLRPAYYQLAEYAREENGRILLTVGGRDYFLA